MLYNLSLSWSVVPLQWKSSVITPAPKVLRPTGCSDYRPISVTPIVSRLLEKSMVTKFVYPIFVPPSCTHLFHDQFAFRPTGSTTAALINLVRNLADLLQTYPYVHLIALDFSKAFDSVRHSTLMQKFSKLPLQDDIYNWITNFLKDRDHCTKLQGRVSAMARISASIVQGMVTGPGSYNVNASDLHPRHPENDLNKYADDTYLIVPSIYSDLVPEEQDHIAEWAKENNLNLNSSKSKEMIIRRPKIRPDDLPGQIAGIERVESMNILGVTLQYDLSIQEHVDRLICKSAQTMYALRLLRSQGLNGPNLWEVTRTTLVSRLTYASQAWSGMITEGSKKQLEAMLAKAIRQGFLPPDHSTFSDICEGADQRLFRSILQNPDHVLHQRLPPVRPQSYNLRERTHDRVIPSAKVHYSRIHLLFECFIKILTDYVLSSTSNFPNSLVYF